MKNILDCFSRSEFLDKFVLLLSTVLLTGLLVPTITSVISENQFRERKIFEAELQRQKYVLDSQSQLLNDLADVLWKFILLNIDVSYYKVKGFSESNYDQAVKKYQNEASVILGRIRSIISRSKRLTTSDTYEKLNQLYLNDILGIDSQLESLINDSQNAPRKLWNDQHNDSFQHVQNKIDSTLIELADEFKLTIM